LSLFAAQLIATVYRRTLIFAAKSLRQIPPLTLTGKKKQKSRGAAAPPQAESLERRRLLIFATCSQASAPIRTTASMNYFPASGSLLSWNA
jgi:hypothetical protein